MRLFADKSCCDALALGYVKIPCEYDYTKERGTVSCSIPGRNRSHRLSQDVAGTKCIARLLQMYCIQQYYLEVTFQYISSLCFILKFLCWQIKQRFRQHSCSKYIAFNDIICRLHFSTSQQAGTSWGGILKA